MNAAQIAFGSFPMTPKERANEAAAPTPNKPNSTHRMLFPRRDMRPTLRSNSFFVAQYQGWVSSGKRWPLLARSRLPSLPAIIRRKGARHAETAVVHTSTQPSNRARPTS